MGAFTDKLKEIASNIGSVLVDAALNAFTINSGIGVTIDENGKTTVSPATGLTSVKQIKEEIKGQQNEILGVISGGVVDMKVAEYGFDELIAQMEADNEAILNRESYMHDDLFYFDTWLLALSKDQAGGLADVLQNIPTSRSLTPLEYHEYITYNHRTNVPFDIESFTRIGDCVFQIPPSFIEVIDQASTEQIGSIRQNGSVHANQAYANREIVIHVFFNGHNQINGYKVEGPSYQAEHFVDGLRPLMAQFTASPFLPIENLLLNQTFNIHAVALSSIQVQTVEGFPETLEATMTLIEFDPEPYTNVECSMFSDMIDWDLFRYNYQRLLVNSDKPKRFPKVTQLHESYGKFKLYSLKTDSFVSEDTEKKVGNLYDKDKYDIFLDSEIHDIHLTNLSFGLSNILPSSQMEGYASPVIQYMGNTDASVTLVFETTDLATISSIDDMLARYRSTVTLMKRYNKVGFIMIENEFTRLTGSKHFVLNTMDTSTVPDFPGLYRVTMQLTSYHVALADDDVDGGELYATRPFNREGTTSDAISNDLGGLHRKVLQDNYVERFMTEKAKLYPDLDLPSLAEVDKAISSIVSFRQSKGLTAYPLSKYPRGTYQQPGSTKTVNYEGYVDPDYYVFYPIRHVDMTGVNDLTVSPNAIANEFTVADESLKDSYTIDARMALVDNEATNKYFGSRPTSYGFVQTGTNSIYSNMGGVIPDTVGDLSRDAYVNLALSKIGCRYRLGAEGEIVGGVQEFDCTSFIAWLFWQFGEWNGAPGKRGTKPISYDYPTCSFMFEVPVNMAQKGDLAWMPGHAGIITGVPHKTGIWETVEAMNPDAGVCKGVFKWSTDQYVRVYRPKCFESSNKSKSTDAVNSTQTVKTASEADASINGGGSTGSSGVSIRTDLRYDPMVTAGVLDKWLQQGLSGYGSMIHHYCKLNDVDPALMAAISAQESKHGTSKVFRERKNTMGIYDPSIGGSRYFSSHEACYEYSAGLLDRRYLSQGLNTIVKIGGVYCPEGAANDPLGLNGYWIPNVTKFYQEIKAIAYDVAIGAIVVPESGEYVPGSTSSYGTELSYVEANPVVPAFGFVDMTSPHEWKKAQAGQKMQAKTLKATIRQDKYEVTSKKVARADDVDAVSGAAPTIESVKSELAEKQVLPYYNGPRVLTDQAKTLYKLSAFGKPLIIKSPVLRMLDASNISVEYVPKSYFSGKTLEGKSYPYASSMIKGAFDALQGMIANDASDARNGTNDESLRWFERSLIESMTGENLFNYMCVDMLEYNARGRLLRAFPTYVFSIVDASGEWLDGRKLWSNYYFYRSILDIKVFQESEQPIHTAQITVTDTMDRLSKSPTVSKDIYNLTKIENDEEYNKFLRKWYEWTGSLIGTPKLTSNMVKLKNLLFDTIDVQEGARVHIRMGYGSNASKLPVVFNGVIAEIEEFGEHLRFTAQSDGAQLLSTPVSVDENKTNGMFKFQAEASNIVAGILSDRKSIVNALNKKWGEPSAYGIENFGIHFGGTLAGATNTELQLDLTKNVYLGRYKPYLYTERLNVFGIDGEDNFHFKLGGKYPWDVMQTCAQFVPEFICQPMYHQFDSTLFYGLPTFPVRYRYDIADANKLETWTESCKTFAQFHLVTSAQDIICNQMKASKKGFSPNAIGLYTQGGTGTGKTPVLYSDRTMDWSKQSTKIYDTTIVQDYLGWDKAYEFIGLRAGRGHAINICISNMLEEWKKTYKGEVIIIGDASIKPLDYIYIDDDTKDISGVHTVRSVIHSMNGNTGFTTSYTPGLIAIDTLEDGSGMINVVRSMTAAGGLATSIYKYKKISNFILKQGKALGLVKTAKWIARETGSKVAFDAVCSASQFIWKHLKSGKTITQIESTLSSVQTFMADYKVMMSLKSGFNTVKNAKVIQNLSTTATTTLTVARLGSVAAMVGSLGMSILFQVALNKVLDAVFDYYGYRNCVKIVPLYRRGRPFCISTTGAKHLILGYNDAITNDEVEMEDDEKVVLDQDADVEA